MTYESDPNRQDPVEILVGDKIPLSVEILWTNRRNQYRLEWNRWEQKSPTLYVPRGTSHPDIKKILKKHHRWILNRISERIESDNSHKGNTHPIDLRDHRLLTEDRIPFNGGLCSVFWEKDSRTAIVHRMEKNEIVLHSPEKPVTIYRETVIRWILAQFCQQITDSLDYWKNCTGLSPVNVFIRPTRSQWGSMSRSKNRSLSWYLTGFPEKTLHYIILHELSHIRFPDHSANFWSFVRKQMPEYRELKKTLRQRFIFPEWYLPSASGKSSIRHPFFRNERSGNIGQSHTPDLG